MKKKCSVATAGLGSKSTKHSILVKPKTFLPASPPMRREEGAAQVGDERATHFIPRHLRLQLCDSFLLSPSPIITHNSTFSVKCALLSLSALTHMYHRVKPHF